MIRKKSVKKIILADSSTMLNFVLANYKFHCLHLKCYADFRVIYCIFFILFEVFKVLLRDGLLLIQNIEHII